MSMFSNIKGMIKEGFTRMNEGGAPISSEWKHATDLRSAAEAQARIGADIEGSLFLSDVKELYEAMDAFNATRPAKMQFSLMIHENSDGVLEKIHAERTGMGFTLIGGLALERNGRVYGGHYFSDMAHNSGFAFSLQGVEKKFQCGLENKTDFEKFAARLLNPPNPYPAPSIYRPV